MIADFGAMNDELYASARWKVFRLDGFTQEMSIDGHA